MKFTKAGKSLPLVLTQEGPFENIKGGRFELTRFVVNITAVEAVFMLALHE